MRMQRRNPAIQTSTLLSTGDQSCLNRLRRISKGLGNLKEQARTPRTECLGKGSKGKGYIRNNVILFLNDVSQNFLGISLLRTPHSAAQAPNMQLPNTPPAGLPGNACMQLSSRLLIWKNLTVRRFDIFPSTTHRP